MNKKKLHLWNFMSSEDVTVGTAVKNKIKILFICNWNC